MAKKKKKVVKKKSAKKKVTKTRKRKAAQASPKVPSMLSTADADGALSDSLDE